MTLQKIVREYVSLQNYLKPPENSDYVGSSSIDSKDGARNVVIIPGGLFLVKITQKDIERC